MRLRPYISSKDYECIQSWVNDERIHALWCANLISYPLTSENMEEALTKDAQEWNSSAYVAVEDDGRQVGFFALAVNVSDNSGFLKFVIVDNELRGKGYGTQMVELVLRYAFEIIGVLSVQLNVFDVNENAKRCYLNAGFVEVGTTENIFTFENESWGRCHMVVSK